MRKWLTALAVMLCAAPAFAQREAISPSLSPEMAASAFEDAVLNGCIASVGKGERIDAGGYRGKLAANATAEARAQIGASSSEQVFDVPAAQGVVAVKESDARCVVSVYGPPASMTIMALSRKLAADHAFERLASAPSPNGMSESLMKTEGGRRMQVMIQGSEPGTPGHKSRFSVVTVTVFAN